MDVERNHPQFFIYRPERRAVTDVLSSVLDILDVQVASSARFEASGDWGLSFPQPGQLKVIAVLAGQCLATAGTAEAIRLRARDCLLLAGNQDFTMLSSPDQAALPQPGAPSSSAGS
jgi:hypothetical protein